MIPRLVRIFKDVENHVSQDAVSDDGDIEKLAQNVLDMLGRFDETKDMAEKIVGKNATPSKRKTPLPEPKPKEAKKPKSKQRAK